MPRLKRPVGRPPGASLPSSIKRSHKIKGGKSKKHGINGKKKGLSGMKGKAAKI